MKFIHTIILIYKLITANKITIEENGGYTETFYYKNDCYYNRETNEIYILKDMFLLLHFLDKKDYKITYEKFDKKRDSVMG